MEEMVFMEREELAVVEEIPEETVAVTKNSDSQVSGATVVFQGSLPSTAERIFRVLSDPSQHHLLDVSGRTGEAEKKVLGVGTHFYLPTRIRSYSSLTYKVKNTVTAFDENRSLGWESATGVKWQWELQPENGYTLIRGTCNWENVKSHKFFLKKKLPGHSKTILKHTVRLLGEHPHVTAA